MEVIPLTVLIGLCLVAAFLAFFLWQSSRQRAGGSEHDSLLPLEEETPRVQVEAAFAQREDASGPEDPACGCRTGLQPPCAGCLKSHHRHHS